MHADRAVHAVVHHQRDERRAVLHGGRDLLAVHQEVAVAAQRRAPCAPGAASLAATAAGIAVAHGPAGRAELGAEALVAEVPVQPAGEVARAVGDDRVLGQLVAQPADHLAVLQLARHRLRLAPRQIFLVRARRFFLPAENSEHSERIDELRIAGVDRQAGR